MVPIYFNTERLLLKNLKTEDITNDYVMWLNDPIINMYLSPTDADHTMESCFLYVESYEETDEKALIGIFVKDSGIHIGNLTLSAISWRKKIGAVGGRQITE